MEKLSVLVTQSPLNQDWDYIDAKAQADGFVAERFVISDENGNPVSLAQILVKNFFFFVKAARLTRGPLILDLIDHDERLYNEIVLGSLEAIRRLSLKKFWLYFSIAPELDYSTDMCSQIKSLGFSRNREPRIGSARLEIQRDDEAILAGFKGKWRNLLRKAWKEDVTVEVYTGDNIPCELVTNTYQGLKKSKNFDGISDNLLYEILTSEKNVKKINVYVVMSKEDNSVVGSQPIGMLLTAAHGTVRTYLIGYTDMEGRAKNVNYLYYGMQLSMRKPEVQDISTWAD